VIIPVAAVAAGLLDLVIAFVLLVPLLIYYGIQPGATLWLVPVFVLLTTVLAIGVGLWSAALNVKYRDIRYALPFLIQLWLFASPVIYPLSLVPTKWRWVLFLNPMAGFIEGFRSALFGRPVEITATAIGLAVTLLILLIGLITFRRIEESFADVI
jgi:lipopolysaccharide transport system permease protein